jgi:hypothetical protein
MPGVSSSIPWPPRNLSLDSGLVPVLPPTSPSSSSADTCGDECVQGDSGVDISMPIVKDVEKFSRGDGDGAILSS